MRAWRVLLTSVVVHAAAIGLWAWSWDRVEPAAVVVPEKPVAVEIVPVKPPQIVEVAFLDESSRSSSPSSSPSRVRIRRSGTSTSTSTRTSPRTSGVAGTSELPATGTSEGGATRHRGLGMRGPELHPSDEAIAHIAEQPGHQGTTAIPSHRLDDAPNGRQVIHDEVTEITVDRDGTAHLHDKPDIDVHIDVNPFAWRENLVDAGKAIALWAENPEGDKQYGPTQDLPEHLQALPDQCATWGDPMCNSVNASASEKAARKAGIGKVAPIFSFGGKLDLTSYLMKKLGVGDAYASRKLKALDDTRLERAEKGAAWKQEQLDHAAELMQANLERVWAGTRDPEERKAVLFELWDECAEGEGPTGVAGEKARAMVIGWIRARLPVGTPAGFTPAELAVLDGRRSSHQHFSPYAP